MPDKRAVDAVILGGKRACNRRFQQMCGHDLIGPVAGTPASGWQKGEVENRAGTVLHRFFAPRLKVTNCEELNARL